jgi:CoA:oxalate CoA-transferase
VRPTTDTQPTAPLAGITVIDLTQQLPGPYATLLLAGLGARVIKVEAPSADVGRWLDPPMFATVNAGKESIVLDLKHPEAQAVLHRLAARADVLVEGFRPGAVVRLSADHTTIAAINPALVYCSISGFGAAGPYRDVPGHDLNYLGVAGGLLDDGRGERAEIGMPVVDLAAGTMAALSIVAALTGRQRTGEGALLDVAMLDSAVFWSNVKVPPAPDGSATADGEPAYGTFAAADGRRLTLGVLEDKFWRNLCHALDWADWTDDPELATHPQRRARAGELHRRLAAALATRPAEAWLERLWAADVPAAPVHDHADAPDDPQVRARGLFVDAGPTGGRPRARAPLPGTLRSPAVDTSAPAAAGADTAAVLAELGYDDVERRELKTSGACPA